MAETKILQPIKTDVTITGNSIGIFTYYSTLKKIFAFITDTVKNVNSVLFKENELGIVNDGYDNTDFYINSVGELIVFSDIADDFNIDANGELTIYEEG